MDVLASRLARGVKTKSKPKKGVKRLSKSDTKENKKKIVSKVNSIAVEKLSKNKENSPKKISLKKKKLIKDALLVKRDQVKNLTKQNTENIVTKQKKAIKGNTEPSNKNISKKIVKSVKKLKTHGFKSDADLKRQDTTSKKRKAPLPVKEDVSSSKVTKKIKVKPIKAATAEKNTVPTKTNVGNLKKLNKNKLQPTKSSAVEGVVKKLNAKSQLTKSTLLKNKDVVKAKEKTNTLKQVKLQLAKSVAVKSNQEIKNIKSKKRKLPKQEIQETGPSLKKKEIINFVKALIKVNEIKQENKKTLFDSEKPPIFLHVTCFKIPKTPLHQHRITLPHSLVNPTDDVVIFVKDLKRGRRRDPEDTIHHYEDIFQQRGITQIKTIMPINQVKTEYSQFEMKRRLFSSYDYFLVDGRISGHIAHLLGKHFKEKRKLPTSVHMGKENLKKEIDNALSKTCLQIHGCGDTSIVEIGTCSMKEEQIADNILAVIEDLSKNFPGKWANIRSLRIKTPLSLAIPIYVSLKNKNEVEVPVIVPKRPKAYKEVEGELSTFISNIKAYVSPDGTVRLEKIADDDSDGKTNEDVENIDIKEEKIENKNAASKVKNKEEDEDNEDDEEDDDEDDDGSED